MHILITGGAGFIGSHLADELLQHNHRVRALDLLIEQVHGTQRARPSHLSADVELLHGDVRDRDAVRRALDGVDAVYHLAASVGVGQSMYEVADYTSTNNLGTAVLLEAVIERPVQRLILASSMSLYGEGLYRASDGRMVHGSARSLEQLRRADWELRDHDGGILSPTATSESKLPAFTSVYALSKFNQEQLCLMIGRVYGIPTVALRLFNVFGTRQALSNPYTGVLAIFASRLLNGNAPLIFEDGLQRRDFVSVFDVARAFHLALDRDEAIGQAINIGSGRSHTIEKVARVLSATLNPSIEPLISGKHRVGDVRHCFADIERARQLLGYEPNVRFEDGVRELAEWVERQQADDLVGEAEAQLAVRGLTL